MDNYYKGTIWTNHALDRLKEREIKQGDAWATFSHPQKSIKGTTPGSWIFYRDYGSERIEVVASKNQNREWVVLSVWSRPISSKNNFSKPNFLENLVERVLQRLFGKLKKRSNETIEQ